MDLIYMVRTGEINNELRASLRSIDKFAPPFDNIRIVGYKPSWVSDLVKYIPTVQNIGSSKHINTNNNLLTACRNIEVSNIFILMNDDFILTRKIDSWEKSINKAKNTIKDQIAESKRHGFTGLYHNAFDKSLPLIQKISGMDNPLNYEQHFPIIINKLDFLALFEIPDVQQFIKTNKIILKRSLYGNCFLRFKEFCDDVKIRNGDPDKFDSDWISVHDNFIGNPRKPKFTKFIKILLSEKSKYEKE